MFWDCNSLVAIHYLYVTIAILQCHGFLAFNSGPSLWMYLHRGIIFVFGRDWYLHQHVIPTWKMKWNKSGFRPPLCTYRLNWARRTSWGWWDDWDDTVLQTQDSKFEPWRSGAEHATSRSRRLPTILTFTRGWGRNIFCFFQTAESGNRTPNSGVKGSGANHYLRAPALPPENQGSPFRHITSTPARNNSAVEVDLVSDVAQVNKVDNQTKPDDNSSLATYTSKTKQCPQCSYSSKCSGNMSRHISIVDCDNTFKCDQCDKVFAGKEYLKRHKQNIHEKNKLILWNSITSTSFVFTELTNTMKYSTGFLYNLVFTEWRHCVSQMWSVFLWIQYWLIPAATYD